MVIFMRIFRPIDEIFFFFFSFKFREIRLEIQGVLVTLFIIIYDGIRLKFFSFLVEVMISDTSGFFKVNF